MINENCFRIFYSNVMGHREGAWQGHTHFWQKLKLGILTKLFHHRVAYDQ